MNRKSFETLFFLAVIGIFVLMAASPHLAARIMKFAAIPLVLTGWTLWKMRARAKAISAKESRESLSRKLGRWIAKM